MNIFRQITNVALVSIAALAAFSSAVAQEVPYGVKDRQKLDVILRGAQTSLASSENEAKWLEVAGIASHQLATMKVEGASNDAVSYLKKAIALEPDNAELLAYLGSAYAMAGRDSSFVVNKVSNVNKGLAALDKAVKKAPRNLNVRFIRGSVSYSVPALFSRKTTAESDYLTIVNEVKAGAQVDPDRLSEAYYKLGQMTEEKSQEKSRKGMAQTYYAQAQKASPQSDWAKQAGRAMK
jgi:tetratricopeptide (TPR) repeat protein